MRRLEGEERGVFPGRVEQQARGTRLRGHGHHARRREAVRPAPVGVRHEDHARRRRNGAPHGARQALRLGLARHAGEAELHEREPRGRGRRGCHHRVITDVSQGRAHGTCRAHLAPDRREPVRPHGAQGPAIRVLRVDHVCTTRDGGARFDGPSDAHQQTHFRALPCGYREAAGRLGFRRRDVKTTIG